MRAMTLLIRRPHHPALRPTTRASSFAAHAPLQCPDLSRSLPEATRPGLRSDSPRDRTCPRRLNPLHPLGGAMLVPNLLLHPRHVYASGNLGGEAPGAMRVV